MSANHYGRMDYCWKIILPGALVGAIVGYGARRRRGPGNIEPSD